MLKECKSSQRDLEPPTDAARTQRQTQPDSVCAPAPTDTCGPATGGNSGDVRVLITLEEPEKQPVTRSNGFEQQSCYYRNNLHLV